MCLEIALAVRVLCVFELVYCHLLRAGKWQLCDNTSEKQTFICSTRLRETACEENSIIKKFKSIKINYLKMSKYV